MAAPLHMKRMARERALLEKSGDDYFAYFEDDDLLTFHAYVIGPSETLYAHKFIKLKIEIPQTYPMAPPTVTFIQHSGGRLHPNLYVDGKVCLSILGTWPGEKWAFAMTVETVLITIRSLLDNSPYKHEPHQRDNPNFNEYVQFASWKSLLLDYFSKEQNPAAREFLQAYVMRNETSLINELQQQARKNSVVKSVTSPYRHNITIDYQRLVHDVIKLVDQCKQLEKARISALAPKLSPSDVSKEPGNTDDTRKSPTAVNGSGAALATSATQPRQIDERVALPPLKRKREACNLT